MQAQVFIATARALRMGAYVPTEFTRYRRCRRHLKSSDFPGDSLLHTGTHLRCAGGVLISVTVEDQSRSRYSFRAAIACDPSF